MTLLAPVGDLANMIGGDADDETFAESATLSLALASGAVRRYTNQKLSEVADDAITLRGGGWFLAIPELPVTALAITIDDEPFTAWELDKSGLLVRTDDRRWPARVGIVYTHGFETIPEDIKRIVLQVAARHQANPAMMRSEQIDDYSYQTADDAAGGAELTEAEMVALVDYQVNMPSPQIVLTGADAS